MCSGVKSFKYPGVVGIGVHHKGTFELTCDKHTKKGIVQKVCKQTAEVGAEATFDIQNKCNFAGKIAAKLLCGKKYTMQAMYDSAFKLSTAFTYAPKKGLKFIWSDQIDTKKLFTNPKDGLDYKYGFTVEFNLSAF